MRWPGRERESNERNERGTRRSESATEGGRAEEERKAPRELKYYARRPRVVGKATGKDGSRGNKRVRPTVRDGGVECGRRIGREGGEIKAHRA